MKTPHHCKRHVADKKGSILNRFAAWCTGTALLCLPGPACSPAPPTGPPSPVVKPQAPTSRNRDIQPPSAHGVIIGSVTYSGPAVRRNVISGKALYPDAPMPKEPVFSESLIVNDDQTISNVVVYIADDLPGHAFMPPTQPIVVDARNWRFAPHVVGIQVGQPVHFRDSEEVPGNHAFTLITNKQVFPSSPTRLAATPQHAPLPLVLCPGSKACPPGQHYHFSLNDYQPWTEVFSSPEVPVRLSDLSYPWMSAYICVFAHPFFNVTNTAGVFQLDGVPAGEYTIVSWHETLGIKEQTVTVEEGKITKITVRY